MPDYSEMTLEELKAELERNQERIKDAQNEREFLGKQKGMHIVTSEFASLDREIEMCQNRIKELDEQIAAKGG